MVVDLWANDLLVKFRAIRVWWPSGGCGVVILELHEDMVPAE